MSNMIDYSQEPTVLMPRNNIELSPSERYLDAKIRQLQTTNIQPVFLAGTPINVVRRNISGNTTQVSIQLIRNPNQTLNTVGVQIQTPGGSLGPPVSSAGTGPLQINVPRSAVPSALQIQGVAITGQKTSSSFGGTVSRALNLL